MPSEVPFYNLDPQNEQIREAVQQALMNVFDAGWYVLGDKVAQFEQEYASYIGVKHCIGVGNGLDALKISLKALGIGKGDEVLVPANTYIATLLAVSDTGAKPVLVEPDIQTCNIDPYKIAEQITAKTRAIIPVHMYGYPCDMDAIMRVAEQHQLFVIEDNAQASGALYKGKRSGSFGHLNAHSFYPTKNLGALGDGGAITTDDDELARKVRLYRNYGSQEKYKNELLGYNSRLDEIQAAVLSIKLRHLEQWCQQKSVLANYYQEGLSGLPGLFLPVSSSTERVHSYHLFVVQSDQRDALVVHLKKDGIQTIIHYPVPPYKQQAYKGEFSENSFPLADSLSARVISLPLFPGMTKAQVDQVILSISRFHR